GGVRLCSLDLCVAVASGFSLPQPYAVIRIQAGDAPAHSICGAGVGQKEAAARCESLCKKQITQRLDRLAVPQWPERRADEAVGTVAVVVWIVKIVRP